MKEFCSLRAESVSLQLSGSSDTVDTRDLNLSDMGTMSNGMGGFGGRLNFGNRELLAPELSGEVSNSMTNPKGDGVGKTEQSSKNDRMEEFAEFLSKEQKLELSNKDGVNNKMPPEQLGTSISVTIILIMVSVFSLAVSLLIAFRYKR